MIEGGVAILDFGSQYSQLIVRRLREMHVYSELLPGDCPLEDVTGMRPAAVILSGGPSSVYEEGAPRADERLFETDLPMLGICYGMQLLALADGGEVEGGHTREYGPAEVEPRPGSSLFEGISGGRQGWMSHGDRVTMVPPGYRVAASTRSLPVAAMENPDRRRFGVQFHPEVAHTVFGEDLLRRFLFDEAGAEADWTMETYRKMAVQRIREQLADGGNVILGLSGGVDSAVVAALLHQAVPRRFHPIFVDTGLLREGERESVEQTFHGHFGMRLHTVDASGHFLEELAGVEDPEEKRKVIGRVFIEVFERAAAGIENVTHLAQGTLYPDVIESVSFRGPSETIKSHHNVGGLPERMDLRLIEPLRELFKDEVRTLGVELGLPPRIVGRHPFPGPGLAVRILGPVNRTDLELLRRADRIYIDYLRDNGLYDEIWQAFAVLLPVRTVGVMGDRRTYDRVVALRAVTSRDGMTADWYRMAPDHLAAISSSIVNRVEGISRVVYDISSKPPGTIEWE
jgi:GMP synthase (glutamine-hydrolysing)